MDGDLQSEPRVQSPAALIVIFVMLDFFFCGFVAATGFFVVTGFLVVGGVLVDVGFLVAVGVAGGASVVVVSVVGIVS